MDMWSWGWLILAVVLLVGEMLTAGFFLIVFGIGAVGSFLVAVFGGSVLWQWITFLVVSALAFAFSRRFAEKVNRGPVDYGVGAERYAGERAWVTETIDAAAATGMVRIDREEWRADSFDRSVIPAETWTTIVEVDGTRMVVKPAEEAGAAVPEDTPVDFGADRQAGTE
jgi:membrane protein implicated in regulation of membrane protease activity